MRLSQRGLCFGAAGSHCAIDAHKFCTLRSYGHGHELNEPGLVPIPAGGLSRLEAFFLSFCRTQPLLLMWLAGHISQAWRSPPTTGLGL